MMIRLLPAAAMTATALAAMTAGAATVDVYGVVDTGLHYVKADSGDTSVTMDSGISKGRLSVRPQRREGGQPDDALQGHQKYPVRQ